MQYESGGQTSSAVVATAAFVIVTAPLLATAQERIPAAGAPLLALRDAVAEALAHNSRLLDSQGAQQADLGLWLARSDFRSKMTPGVLGCLGQTDVSNQTCGLDMWQCFLTGTTLGATVGTSTSRNQLGNFYSTDTTLSLSQWLLREITLK